MRGLLLCGVVIAACFRPASVRTAADASVGHLHAGAISIDVDDGLATVHPLTDSSFWMWAQSPVWRAHIDAKTAVTIDLDLRNLLPDAKLRLDGQEVPALSPDAALAVTRKRARLDLSAGTHTLEVGPDDATSAAPFRFGLLSDVQEAIGRVGDIYSLMAEDPSLRFVMSAGDLADKGKPEELAHFQDLLLQLPVPFFAACGNHDIASSETAFRDVFGRGNFHFVYRGVHFTVMDSASATLDPEAYSDLEGWLNLGQSSVHVTVMHVPPFDPVGGRNASFGDRDEAAMLVEKLARGNVDLSLYGHIHSFYRFEHAGIPVVISGGGGAHPERLDDIGRHYVTVDVSRAGVIATAMVRVD